LDEALPVLVQKDTNASALGEYFFGAARGCPDFVYLSVGTGLGSGIFAAGHLITGSTWLPGDLGHLSLDPDGLACVCGQRGCAETVISGLGLIRLVREWSAQQRYPTGLKASPDLNAQVILAAAREGDPLAQAAFNLAGNWLGQIIAMCIAMLDPARIVLGGGVALAAFDLLVEPAQIEIRRRVHPRRFASLEILPSQLTSSAIGPACLVWYEG
jgi:glucokinase